MRYEDILDRLEPKLRAIAKKVKGRYSYCDENDFYQEAALYLWLLFQRGELANKTDSYILQGCYYFLKNYIRKICKGIDRNSTSLYNAVSEDDNTLEEVVSLSAYTTGDKSVEIFLLLDEVEGRFTEREKDVFYYQLEGLTTREIGERIGVSHVAVVKTGNRIRQKCEVFRKELV